MKRVLILSPHTDDAELGCGGTIYKFIKKGSEILWVVFSTAENSLPSHLPRETLKNEFINVSKSFGLKEKNILTFNFQVRKLPEHRQEILEKLVRIRNKFKPTLVIMPSLNDVHQDHQVVANEAIRAFKTTSSIICYELPWNHTTFNTQFFSELTLEEIKKKVTVLKNYKSQIELKRPYFSEKFIFGLGKVRGVQCNSDFAEAFEVIRWRM
jgi:N-acetylglucosamine malate deacetylase 1